MTREEAAQARAAALPAPAARPSQRRSTLDESPQSRGRVLVSERGAVEVQRDGGAATFSRYASITETPYEMYDMFGPYTEVVSADAFAKTLGADPLVEFSVNHGRSIPMAHTRNGTLALSVDEHGLRYTPTVDTRRTDVADAVLAMERGDLVESSFKFRIVSGQWSPDYAEYRINEVDLHRGDVSIVNFGANPFTADYTPRTNPFVDIIIPKYLTDVAIPRYKDSKKRDAELDGPHPVTPRQKALYDAVEAVVETFGQFDQSSGPDGAHYVAASPFEGLACGSCAFYDGARACEVVAGDIAPEGVCKFWLIPADLLAATARAAKPSDAHLRARLALALAD
jgi:HK97 family phage prohead protease